MQREYRYSMLVIYVVDGELLASSPVSEHAQEKVNFFSGIPSVDVTKGILHLYKARCLMCVDCNN